jgi:hypothetical protein
VWSKEAWAQAKQVPQPDFTCVRITEHLLVSLQGATKAQVIKAMKANGKPFSDKYDILHFLSIPDGPANFTFENDKVVHICGNVILQRNSVGETQAQTSHTRAPTCRVAAIPDATRSNSDQKPFKIFPRA